MRKIALLLLFMMTLKFDTAVAQSFRCTLYAGAGGTPLPYTTILQAKAGSCLNDRLKLEFSYVDLRDTLDYARHLKFYSLSLRYHVWGGWYALFGPAYTHGTIESTDHNFRGERKSSSLDTGIGYEWYWETVPIVLNLDLARKYHELKYSTEYRAKDGKLPTDFSKEDADLNAGIVPLMLSVGIYF